MENKTCFESIETRADSVEFHQRKDNLIFRGLIAEAGKDEFAIKKPTKIKKTF